MELKEVSVILLENRIGHEVGHSVVIELKVLIFQCILFLQSRNLQLSKIPMIFFFLKYSLQRIPFEYLHFC